MLYELEQIANKVFDKTTFPQVRTLGYINGYNHYEKDGHLFIEVDAPGFNKKDIDVSADNDLLRIKAEARERDDDGFTRGGLNKVIRLPKYAEIDDITASSKDGVVTIKVPLSAKSKKIKIK